MFSVLVIKTQTKLSTKELYVWNILHYQFFPFKKYADSPSKQTYAKEYCKLNCQEDIYERFYMMGNSQFKWIPDRDT